MIVLARSRCQWLVTQPWRFPELYGDAGGRLVGGQLELVKTGRRGFYRKRLEEYARIMAALVYRCDVQFGTRRVGDILPDGSCTGFTQWQLAKRVGMRRKVVPLRWLPGRRGRLRAGTQLQVRLSELRRAGLVGGHETRGLGKPSNERYIDPEKGMDRWKLYPAVLTVTENFFAKLDLRRELAETYTYYRQQRENEALRGVSFFDQVARRERNRQISVRREQLLAAKRAFRARGGQPKSAEEVLRGPSRK